MIALHESSYGSRVRVAAELHDARELVRDLLALALVTGSRRVAAMLAEAVVQCAQVQRRYVDLHRPARPYATAPTTARSEAA